MSYNDNVCFFYENAGYSYDPATETPEEGRQRCAERLAQVEAWGQRSGYWFVVDTDPDPHWDDDVERETTDYDQWRVLLYSTDGEQVGSLYSIDNGPDADEHDPYIRVVKAELLSEVAPDDTEHIEIPADELEMIEHLRAAQEASNRVDGYHTHQFGGTYGAVRSALLLALAIALGGKHNPPCADVRVNQIAKALADAAADNGENIAYQIELWNEGRIS